MSEETNERESNQKEIRNEVKKHEAKKKKTADGARLSGNGKKSKTATGEMVVTPVKTNAVRQRG